MLQVNVLEAKTELSRLIKLIESGKEDEIVIARYGKPIVTMPMYKAAPVENRIGIAKGKFEVPDDLDRDNDEVEALFGGGL